ncbi:hypothetical protein COCSUDRAFT_33854 [Coccomyxa subellipsoidea C-169]|uniref:Uncharacterized protein n=1 Tax=Coccomyxa subellipsoidea (strain C-169) TaxID=574566 RepID=I0YQK0_COCSC|nr:hypothetical protein COCSUDRAFT_33854 [Coccomyxa subellipsoidea C-169]EIE20669.1 hypothetical protein COCSUDRAFT_33854 [Coccomyxa subellipsoidea C-169]|eukprot:XP_005645213.1 hypothetical protein COCSUDRAFT_33854 [Coccomyxa subellipsoidea C-169]
MHPRTQTSINCQKGLQAACGCMSVQPFAVIVKTAQILAITALLGETSKGGTQCPTMLAATCIAKLLHRAQLSGLQRHTWTGRCSRSCNQVKTAGG